MRACRAQSDEVNGDWKEGAHVLGAPGSPTGDLRFSGLTTVNLRAFADLNDGRATFARQFGHVIKRHANRVGNGFVLVKDEVGQKIEKLLLRDENLVMVGRILARHIAGLVEFVMFGIVAETNRVGAYGPVHQARHQRDVRR